MCRGNVGSGMMCRAGQRRVIPLAWCGLSAGEGGGRGEVEEVVGERGENALRFMNM